MRNWGRVVVGVLLIALGIGWLLDMAGIVALRPGVLTSIALMIVGIGLVIGSLRGSYPGLIGLGVVLMLILTLNGGVSTGRDGLVEFGSRDDRQRFTPRDPSELKPYRANTGVLLIALDQMRIDEAKTYRVQARVDTGELRVVVPDLIPVRVNSRVAAGSLAIDLGPAGKHERSGLSIRDTYESPGFDRERTRFVLDLRAGVGKIRVVIGPTLVPLPGKVVPTVPPEDMPR